MIYEATISYLDLNDKGEERTAKETFIVENEELFAHVENKLLEEFSAYKNIDVTAIKRSKLREVANARSSVEDKIFTATLVDVFLNDDGSEKETKYTIAFFAKNITAANEFVNEYVKQGYDMSVTAIKETNISDVL